MIMNLRAVAVGSMLAKQSSSSARESRSTYILDKLFVSLIGKGIGLSDSVIPNENEECADVGLHQRLEILSRAGSSQNLDALEALYVNSKSPALFQRKEFVHVLKLLQQGSQRAMFGAFPVFALSSSSAESFIYLYWVSWRV